jgi:uncharacterized protein YutE (UPF0331/DUF86 family)
VSVRPTLPKEITAILADLPRHYIVLRYALETLGEDFSPERFATAWGSPDPAEVSRVYAVEHGFELLTNYIGRLTVDGLRLTGERRPDESANLPRDLRRLRDAGVIPEARCERLIRFVAIRNELQHEYPWVKAAATYAAAVELVDELPRFLRDYGAWLRKLGYGERR